jgi:hypothetical protein
VGGYGTGGAGESVRCIAGGAEQQQQQWREKSRWALEREALRAPQSAHVQMPEAGVVGGGGKYTFKHLCELYWGGLTLSAVRTRHPILSAAPGMAPS